MKLTLAIFLVCACGCAANEKPTPVRPLSVLSSQALSTAPPPAIGYTLHFVYLQPLTNAWLESSTDLVHWEERSDFTVTNGQWLVKMDPAKPREFYRAGGEPLP